MSLSPTLFIRHVTCTVIAVCVSSITGCANMSGIGGSSTYGCKAPDGVKCESVSGNYYNAIQNNLPSQRQRSQRLQGNETAPSAFPSKAKGVTSNAIKSVSLGSTKPIGEEVESGTLMPEPLRSQARVLRLWYKPWEDADADLYSQGYVYVQVNSGRWLIEHTQREIRKAYASIKTPRSAAVSTGEGSQKTAATQPRPSSASQGVSGPVTQAFKTLSDRETSSSSKDNQ